MLGNAKAFVPIKDHAFDAQRFLFDPDTRQSQSSVWSLQMSVVQSEATGLALLELHVGGGGGARGGWGRGEKGCALLEGEGGGGGETACGMCKGHAVHVSCT